MKSDTSLSAEALLAERSRLENLLDVSEDWRALQQLRSRSARGEGLSAIDAANLEAMLVQALADNPFYGPYRSICLAIDRLSGGSAPTAKSGGTPSPADSRDNFTRIRGVNAVLAKRLTDSGVTTFAEIADWRAADIQRVSSELQLGKQIYAQNWIEQAALLAATSPNKPPPKTPPATAASAPITSVAPDTSAAPVKPTADKADKRPTATPAPSVSREPAAAPRVEPQVQSKAEPTPAPAPTAALVPSVQGALPIDMPEPDPNQLTLDFARKSARPVAPPAAAPASKAATASSQSGASSTPAAPHADVPISNERASDAPSHAARPVTSAVQADPPASAVSPAPPKAPTEVVGPAPATAAPVVAAAPTPPIGPPPRPIVPRHYWLAKSDVIQPSPAKVAPPSVLDPLVVHPPASSASAPKPAASLASAPSTPVMPPSVAAHALVTPLLLPPRPLVITRASLPRHDPVAIAPPTTAPPPLPATAASVSVAPAASGAPAMSIAEALAYAAEIAKQGQTSAAPSSAENAAPSSTVARTPQPDKTPAARVVATAPAAPVGVTVQPPRAAPPPPPLPGSAAQSTVVPAAKTPASASPPVMTSIVPPRLTPPPLPPTFKTPEPPPPPPPPPRPQPAPRATRVEHARPTEREDFANRSNVEEASVEIVRKQPSGPATPLDPAMAAALAASNLQAKSTRTAQSTDGQTQTAEADKPSPRGGTPIGRFLKALTGN